MNGLTARWIFRLTPDGRLPGGRGHAPNGGQAVSPLVDRLLEVRGINGTGNIDAFLDPKLTQLHDPSLIPDMDKAAARLLDAVKRGEKIVIYGDYDVDGITASAILYHTLKAISAEADVRTYVPHRLEEGYGLNSEAIRELAREGAKVIVSVDCGVTATGPALEAQAAGVDLIITDHHNPPRMLEDLPKAYAVVHPRRPDSRYPFGELSGAGVAFKLAWRVCTMACGAGEGSNGRKVDPKLREMLIELLAFAALGTIADIVPLVGENRVLAKFGLGRAKKSPFVGLRALVEASGLAGEEIGAMEVGFRLGPRLNAAGRMGHARDAVELFTTATSERAKEIATYLSKQNEQRRAVEKSIFESACAMAEESKMTGLERRAIILAHEEWHAGVVGIVCSRLVEKFHRPALLMQRKDGSCHGSGRSIEGFNLHAGLVHCAAHLDKFGGHDMAAGLHVSDAKLPLFVESFTEYANAAIADEHLTAAVQIDCEAEAAELSTQAIADLQRLGPFGAGNAEPRVLVRGLRVMSKQHLGSQAKHLTVALRTPEAGVLKGLAPSEWRAVGWSWGEHAGKIPVGATVDAVIRPRVSYFTGSARIEPEICDLAIR